MKTATTTVSLDK
ncbi:hypothetical protein Tco_0960459, partial [Tanacetum coccineum]